MIPLEKPISLCESGMALISRCVFFFAISVLRLVKPLRKVP